MVLQRDGDRGQAVLKFGLEHVGYLRSDAGAQALGEISGRPLTDSTLVADIAWARERFGEHAAVLVETTMLRRKAAAKLARADGWLFTDEALQQATAEPVARHRARRLVGRRVHDATCSIGTELAALADSADTLLGSDIDQVRLAMARHNLGPDIALFRADALRPITRDAVVVVDPARRTAARRRFDPRSYAP
ncbi:MAG: class I SAM-dependent methyltransferase, partial [Actinomycetota bacterium]|nr:class I SAM-dependent methyltransferase [Actinomycetota bacterium]